MYSRTSTSAAAAAASSRSAVRQVEIGPEHQGQRLDRTLAQLLPGVPRSRLFRLIRRGEVRVNGHRAGPDRRLVAGDRLRLPPVRAAAAASGGASPGTNGAAAGAAGSVSAGLIRVVEACIIHADERLLVLDKPAGLAVHGGSGVSFGVIEALRASRPQETLELAHRLDRDTSGILLVARRRSALRALHALLREAEVRKSYLALVAGRWQLGHRHIDAPLRTDLRVGGERTVRVARAGAERAGGVGRGGAAGRGGARAAKPALTEFRLIEHYGARASLLEATLHTGRTHQIRVHAAHAGHPIAGDDKYGDPSLNAQLRALGLRRMFLHAHTCSFVWPDSGAEQSFSAPLPAELRGLLERLSPVAGGGRLSAELGGGVRERPGRRDRRGR